MIFYTNYHHPVIKIIFQFPVTISIFYLFQNNPMFTYNYMLHRFQRQQNTLYPKGEKKLQNYPKKKL